MPGEQGHNARPAQFKYRPTGYMNQLLHLPMRQHLRTLTLDNMKLTEIEVAPLYEFCGLQSLQLVVVRGRAFQHLSRLTTLRSLTTWNCEWVNSDVLAQIGSLARLEHLTLNCCDQITDEGLRHLSSLVDLQSLGLTDLTVISEVGLRHLSTLTNLESLTLAYNPVTDAMCKEIAEHHTEKLQVLDLDASSVGEGVMTDVGLAHLAKLSKIRRLKLGFHHQFTPAGLVAGLGNLTNLESLSLESVEGCVSGDSLKGLSKLVHLRKFNVDSCPDFDDEAMSALVHFTALEHLNIAKTMIRRGLSHLSSATHPSLTYLDMSYSERLDDAGLREITKLCNLTTLHLFRCPKGRLTTKGTRSLLDLPKLELLDARECPISKDVSKILRVRIKDMREDLGISNKHYTMEGDTESEELPDSDEEDAASPSGSQGTSPAPSPIRAPKARSRLRSMPMRFLSAMDETHPSVEMNFGRSMANDSPRPADSPTAAMLAAMNAYLPTFDIEDYTFDDSSDMDDYSMHDIHPALPPLVNPRDDESDSDSEASRSMDVDVMEDDEDEQETRDRTLLAQLVSKRTGAMVPSKTKPTPTMYFDIEELDD